MPTVKMKIDVSGTVGDKVWRNLRHFDQEQSASFEYRSANVEACNHPGSALHAKGEFIFAKIRVETPLLAQYAVAHYLEQDRVVDADVED